MKPQRVRRQETCRCSRYDFPHRYQAACEYWRYLDWLERVGERTRALQVNKNWFHDSNPRRH